VKKMNDLSKIYHFSVDTKDSSAGLITFIFTLILLFMMCSLMVVYLIRNKNSDLTFFPKDLWTISLVGSMILLCTIFSIYGNVQSGKCFLKLFIFNTGFYLNITPIFMQLMVNFPEKNKLSEWFNAKKNKYLFIVIVLVIQYALLGMSMSHSYTIENILILDGENYQKCVMNHTFNNVLIKFIEFTRIGVLALQLILFFVEWNIKETSYEIKVLFSHVVIDILLLFIFQIFIDINYNSYISSNVLIALFVITIAISNYVFIYLLKMKSVLLKRNNSLENMVDKIRKNSAKYMPTIESTNNTTNQEFQSTTDSVDSRTQRHSSIHSSASKQSGISKVMQYHYQQTKQ